MAPTLAEKIAGPIVGALSIGGLLTLFPEVLSYSGSPTDLIWHLLFAAGIASVAMWLIGSRATESIARIFVIGVLGGVPTIGWHLIVNYGIPESIATITAMLVSMVGTMAVVLLLALISDNLRGRIAGPY